MVIYRLEETLTCWHFDMLTGWCGEDTLMLTFWLDDMQTSRHGDLLTGCWRANMLTCRYVNVQTRWQAGLLTCWHWKVQTRWCCHAWRDADTWTYCHTEMLTWGLCVRHWGPCVSVQSPLPFKTIKFEQFTIFPEVCGLHLTCLTIMFIFSKASRCYQKAFDLDPSCDDAGIALGDSLMELGQEVHWHESAEWINAKKVTSIQIIATEYKRNLTSNTSIIRLWEVWTQESFQK